MQQGQASRTAEGSAAVRAIHRLQDEPRIFDDPYALELTSPAWRRIARSGPLRWLVTRVLLPSLRPIAAETVVRSRYTEELLEQAIARGTRQYVIVGAGFDSFALRRRDDPSGLRVFELDHPDTQRVKIERIRSLGIESPDFVEFVGVDLERHAVAEALADSSFDAALPAFFSWLGTVPYLSNDAAIATLRSIAGCAAPGSEIVFDYLVPDEVLSDPERRVVEKLRAFTARRGEPLVGAFHPDELGAALGELGLVLVENLSGREQEKRYFAGRDDGLLPLPSGFFAHVRVSGAAPTAGARSSERVRGS